LDQQPSLQSALCVFFFLEEEEDNGPTASSTIVGPVHDDDRSPCGRIVRVARAVKISVRVNYHCAYSNTNKLEGWSVSDVINFRLEQVIISRLSVARLKISDVINFR
jgi:hypothetical protein